MKLLQCNLLRSEQSAVDIVQLHHIMFPKTTSATEHAKSNINGLPIVQVRTRLLI